MKKVQFGTHELGDSTKLPSAGKSLASRYKGHALTKGNLAPGQRAPEKQAIRYSKAGAAVKGG